MKLSIIQKKYLENIFKNGRFYPKNLEDEVYKKAYGDIELMDFETAKKKANILAYICMERPIAFRTPEDDGYVFATNSPDKTV